MTAMHETPQYALLMCNQPPLEVLSILQNESKIHRQHYILYLQLNYYSFRTSYARHLQSDNQCHVWNELLHVLPTRCKKGVAEPSRSRDTTIYTNQNEYITGTTTSHVHNLRYVL